MKIPQTFKNMKLVKQYKNFALYENEYYRECFTYYELGCRTKQVEIRKIRPEWDRFFWGGTDE